MSIRALATSLRGGLSIDKSARSFRPTTNVLERMGYDSQAKSFGLFGPGSGRTNPSSQQDARARKTHSAVDEAVKNGDVLLVDTSRFNVNKDVKQSVINIYNPRRVILNDKSGDDPTTRAERREQELEARRRRRLGASAAAGAAGAAGGGAAGLAGLPTTTDGNEQSALGKAGEVLMDLLLYGGGSLGGASLLSRVFRRFRGRSSRPPVPPKPPTPRTTPRGGGAGAGAIDDAVRARTSSAAAGVVGDKQARAAGIVQTQQARIPQQSVRRIGVRPGAFSLRGMIDDYMLRHALHADAGGRFARLRAAGGTAKATTAAIAGTRFGLAGAGGLATFGLGIVAEVLAQIAARRLNALSDEILQQREMLHYPYGKNKYALHQVMQQFGGVPASTYHAIAAQSLGAFMSGYTDPDTNEFVPGVVQNVEAFKQKVIQEERAKDANRKVKRPTSTLERIAEAKGKEYEKMLTEQIPPELMLSNPGADTLGQADNLMEGLSPRRMMSLHVQKAALEGESDPIIQGPESGMFQNLENVIRNTKAVQVQEGQDIMQSIESIPLVGPAAAFVANKGADLADFVGGLFSSPANAGKNVGATPNAEREAAAAASSPTVVINQGGGGGGGTEAPSTTREGNETQEIRDSVIGNGQMSGNSGLD